MVCMLLLLAIILGTFFKGTNLLFMIVKPPWEREFKRFCDNFVFFFLRLFGFLVVVVVAVVVVVEVVVVVVGVGGG